VKVAFEILDLKQPLYQRLDAVIDPDAILTSNTWDCRGLPKNLGSGS